MLINTSSRERHDLMLKTALGEQLNVYLDDPDVIEIILNPDGAVWVECLSKGKYKTDLLMSDTTVANVIKLIAASVQEVADHHHPELSCELISYQSRFQAWVPPVVTAPCFNIRKHMIRALSLDDYLQQSILTQQQYHAIKQAVQTKKNIIIAGGTGSGKTTFANAILHELSSTGDRLVVLEDLPELKIEAPDHVKLRTTENKSMRDLVKGVLRMRPDRIVIGEVRDGAALDLLKAWNTGHPGGLCTIHANDAQAALTRLEDLIAEVIPVVPKRLIDETVDIVIFMQRSKDGKYHMREFLEC